MVTRCRSVTSQVLTADLSLQLPCYLSPPTPSIASVFPGQWVGCGSKDLGHVGHSSAVFPMLYHPYVHMLRRSMRCCITKAESGLMGADALNGLHARRPPSLPPFGPLVPVLSEITPANGPSIGTAEWEIRCFGGGGSMWSYQTAGSPEVSEYYRGPNIVLKDILKKNPEFSWETWKRGDPGHYCLWTNSHLPYYCTVYSFDASLQNTHTHTHCICSPVFPLTEVKTVETRPPSALSTPHKHKWFKLTCSRYCPFSCPFLDLLCPHQGWKSSRKEVKKPKVLNYHDGTFVILLLLKEF